MAERIRIPYFKVFEHEAKNIKDILVKGTHVTVKVDLGLPNPDNRVEYELWFSSVFDLSTELIKEVADAQKPFQNNTLFTPRIMTYDCETCPRSIREDSCVSNGRYCPFMPTHGQILEKQKNMKDVEVIKESIREKCIYQVNLDRDPTQNFQIFFNYLLNVRAIIDKGKFNKDF